MDGGRYRFAGYDIAADDNSDDDDDGGGKSLKVAISIDVNINDE